MTSPANAVGTADVVIVGGGIVGLATAYALLQQRPGVQVTLLEKESELATHQTGRNSGVIHSGVYYVPGSAKARYAKLGSEAMYAFARKYGIAVEQCGKAIVATSLAEIEPLAKLEKRAAENGLEAQRLSPAELKEREPHVSGIAALWIPITGIVDYVGVCETLRSLAVEGGAQILTGAEVVGISESSSQVTVTCADGTEVAAKVLVNCAGLYSDRIARLAGLDPEVQILPFRGEYFELIPTRRSLVKGLVYPVPDPAYPFLGVHLTRGVHGGVHVGPNAVLALAREGYKLLEINAKELGQTLTYPGFWRFARKHWRMGATEYHRSISRRSFVEALQKLVPEVELNDLEPAPAGVRAQAVRKNGQLVDDFLFVDSPRSVQVLNAPSPAATASLPIGSEIATRALARL